MQRSAFKAIAGATLAAGLLSGCVEPVSMTIATTIVSYSFEGFSYAAEGKSIGDIAISQVSDQDCALVRIVKDEPICRDYTLQERRDMAVALVEADRYDRRASRVSDPDLYMPLKSPRPILVAEAEEAQAKLDDAQGKVASPVETAAMPVPIPKPDKPPKAAGHRAPHASTLLAASTRSAAPMPDEQNRATLPAEQAKSRLPSASPPSPPAAAVVGQSKDASPNVIPANGAPAFGDPEKQFWMPL
jgi:hypothetical protein